jgi:EmrB/QacA subfamily drug resistance transporter
MTPPPPTPPDPDPQSGPLPGAPGDRRRWLILATLCASVFVIVLDGTIVNVALPTLVRELGATTSQLQWIVDAYVLVFAGLLMAAGSLGDRLGRKGMLQIGLVVFAITSAMAGLAGSAGELIAWRAAMGIGAAMIFPATLAILVNVFTTPRERATAIGVWAATTGLAVALGPVSGGLLLERFEWGSIFLVNIPVIAVVSVAVWLVVPTSRDEHVGRFDPLGVILSIGAISVLVWAVIEGPVHGWTSSTSIAAFVVAALLLVAFVRWELRIDHPMLDVNVFRNLRFSAGSVSVTFAFFALFGFIFMVTQYFQFVLGYSALEAGLRTVPFALFTGIVSPVSAKLAERYGSKVIVTIGLASMSVGFVWTTFDTASTPYWMIVGQMFFMGGGLGLVNAPATESIMGALPRAQAGVGSAVNDTARELGGVFGVAVVGSVFSSVYGGQVVSQLAGAGVPQPAIDTASTSVGAGMAVAEQATSLAGPEAGALVKSIVDQAFIDGFGVGAWVSATVVACGALLAWRFLPARGADGPADVADDVPMIVSDLAGAARAAPSPVVAPALPLAVDGVS